MLILDESNNRPDTCSIYCCPISALRPLYRAIWGSKYCKLNQVEFANGAGIYLCGDPADGTIAFALDMLAQCSNVTVIPNRSEKL